jgi:branched-chain amino acid transport system substrate-binding protein
MTTRRHFLQGTAAAAMSTTLPQMAQAQASGETMRIGLLTVKTGPLASGGIDMERALVMYLNERNNTLAGVKVQLFVADTGGVPANAKSKVQELVELNKVHVLMAHSLPSKRWRLTTTSRPTKSQRCQLPQQKT